MGWGLGGVKNCPKFRDVIYGQPLPRTLPIFFSFPRTPFLTHLQIGALGITFIDLFETKKLGFRDETTLIQTYYEKTRGDRKLIFADFNTLTFFNNPHRNIIYTRASQQVWWRELTFGLHRRPRGLRLTWMLGRVCTNGTF
jgi:hypothetical protein